MAAQANIKAVITAEDRASGALKGFGNAVENVNDKIVSSAKRAAQALAIAAAGATVFAVKSAADFEQTRIGLENMLGSADKARVLLKDISKFAAETPFEFPELAQAVRQLVAFGFTGEDAFDAMKQLGNVSAAVGAPINDLAYLMGTLRAQGRAFTIDIRQFAMRGIPIYEYLGKVLNKNTQEITAMIEAGQIGFPEVQKAFQLLAGEGGKWGDTMARQSKSLSGLFSTLKDTLGQTARELVGITQEGDIKEGSLFALLRDAIGDLIVKLPVFIGQMKEIVRDIIPQLQQWAGVVRDVATQIADYLAPKLQALWDTIKESMPTYKEFFDNILVPLAGILGTALVLAIGFAIDALNFLLETLKPVISYLAQNEHVFWAIVAVLGAIRTALFLQGALAAFQGVMRGVALTYGPIAAMITAPLVMPAIAVGAALVALWSVRDAAFAAWDAVRNAKNAAENLDSSTDAAVRRMQTAAAQARARGDTAGAARISEQIRSIAGQRASGGPVTANSAYLVGERGPELFVPNKSGSIVPNNALGAGNVSLNVNVGMYAGSEMEKRKMAQAIFDALRDVAQSKNMTMQEMLR